MERFKITEQLHALYRQSIIPRSEAVVLLAFCEGEEELALSTVGRDVVDKEGCAVIYSTAFNPFPAVNEEERDTCAELGKESGKSDTPPTDLQNTELTPYFEEKSEDSAEKLVDGDSILGRISCVAIAVTGALLEKKDEVLRLISDAEQRRLPVLPVLIEPVGLAEYTELFKNRQYIDRSREAENGVGYEEKLSSFFHLFVVSSELRDNIRASLRGTVFLSYRKADRAAAKELMRRIHSLDGFADLAIWYDEYITAGAGFDTLLEEQISSADGFIMALTPKLIEGGNYVERVEYPLAKRLEKPIIPVLASPVATDRVGEIFPDSPPVISSDEELFSALRGIFGEREGKMTPEATYHLGIAYVYGIDVELDRERGLSLIIQSAKENHPDAILKLVEFLENGFILDKDVERAEELLLSYTDKAVAECLDEELIDCSKLDKVVGRVVDFARRNDRLATYDEYTKAHLAAGRIALESGWFVDSPYYYLRCLIKRLTALEYIGDPVTLCKEAEEGFDYFEKMTEDTEVSTDAECKYLEAKTLLASAYRTTGREEEHEALLEAVGRFVEQFWRVNRSLDTAYSLISVTNELFYAGKAEDQLRYAELLHDMCLYCFTEKRSPLTRVQLIEAHIKMAKSLCPDEKEDAKSHIEDARALIGELDEEYRGNYEFSLKSAEELYLEALGDIEGAYKLCYELFDGLRKRAEKSPSAELCRQAGRYALRLRRLCWELEREEDEYVYLAHALEFHYRAAELNPSPETQRALSGVYDLVAGLPFVQRRRWEGARRHKIDSHAGYAVKAEDKAKEKKKEMKLPLIIFFISLFGCLVLVTVGNILSRNGVVMNELVTVLLVPILTVCLVKSLYHIISARHYLKGVKAVDIKLTDAGDYEGEIRKCYRYYRVLKRLCVPGLIVILAAAAVFIVCSLCHSYPMAAVIPAGVLACAGAVYKLCLYLSEESLESVYLCVARLRFYRHRYIPIPV